MGRSAFKWDAFVSYKHDGGSDEEAKYHIVRTLAAEGLSVWHDGRLKGGQNTFGEIYPALERSRVVIAIFSHASVKSFFCSGETFVGFGRGRMIPVLMPNFKRTDFPFDDYRGITALKYGGAKEMAAIVDAAKNFRNDTGASPRQVFPTWISRNSVRAAYLKQVSNWPPPDTDQFTAAIRLKEAEEELRKTADLRGLCNSYNRAEDTHAALTAITTYLDDHTSSPAQWRALATLAQPMYAQLAGYALTRAEASRDEIADFLGMSVAKMDEETIGTPKARTPEQETQTIKLIREVRNILHATADVSAKPPASLRLSLAPPATREERASITQDNTGTHGLGRVAGVTTSGRLAPAPSGSSAMSERNAGERFLRFLAIAVFAVAVPAVLGAALLRFGVAMNWWIAPQLAAPTIQGP